MKIHSVFENIDKWTYFLPQYKFRKGQIEYSEAILKAFHSETHLIAEAGTGTGKTMGYLIASLLFLKENEYNDQDDLNRIIISTETKALQNQILFKDLPLAQKILNTDFQVSIALGSNNYLCKRRFFEFLKKESKLNLKDLIQWEKETENGILLNYHSEIPDIVLNEISRIPSLCLAKECPNFNVSYYFLEKEKWKKSHILIVNHHLLSLNILSDYTILPKFQYAILDEAHFFPSIFRDSSIRYLSIKEIEDFIKNYKFEDIFKNVLHTFRNSIQNFTQQKKSTDSKYNLETSFEIPGLFELINTLNQAKEKLQKELSQMSDLFQNIEGLQDKEKKLKLQNGIEFIDQSIEILDIIYEGPVYNRVHYIEKIGGNFRLCISYVDVSDILFNSFFKLTKSVIFTSATLSIGQNFDYFIEKTGLKPFKETVQTLIVESPFNYEEQSIYYIPFNLPDPQKKEFLDEITGEIINLIELVQGNTLVIFTSRQNLIYVYEKIYKNEEWMGRFKKHKIQIFSQEIYGAQLSLEKYFQNDNSVLFGLDSFRQGIDIPGDKLRCVILVKLPFSVPSDPVYITQTLMEKEKGREPFLSVHVPEMIIKLKQGIGRLIRTESDRGIVAILDPRIYTKNYGKMILSSLSKAKIVNNFDSLLKNYGNFNAKYV